MLLNVFVNKNIIISNAIYLLIMMYSFCKINILECLPELILIRRNFVIIQKVNLSTFLIPCKILLSLTPPTPSP